MKIERRHIGAGFELRAQGEGGKLPLITGHAALFNTPSSELVYGDFYEMIMPGAFSKSLASPDLDVEAVIQHHGGWIPIARLRNSRSINTLRLVEDERGLLVEIDPANTSDARDVIESIGRGDMDQMSFAFRAMQEDWSQTYNGYPLRRLIEVVVSDVSIVTTPYYAGAEVGLRGKHGGSEMTKEDYAEKRKMAPYIAPVSHLDMRLNLEALDS